MRKTFDAPVVRCVRDALFFMVFFSLITGFIEATYTFGLLGVDIPPEIVYVLFLLSPFLLLIVPRSLDSRPFAAVTSSLALAFWAISLPLDTRWRMLATGVGSGLSLVFLACHVRQSAGDIRLNAAAAGFGVLLSILLRSLHAGNLLLTGGWSFVLGAALAGVCLVLVLAGLFSRPPIESAPESPKADKGAAPLGAGRAFGLSLGLSSVLILLYFGFTSPTVIARWGDVSYTAVTAVEAGALALFLGLWLGVPGFRRGLSPVVLLCANLLFIVGLAFALLLRQPHFTAATQYPLYAPDPNPTARIAFWAMLALHPVLYADFAVIADALFSGRPSPRKFTTGFGLGALLLLFLSFAQIFTTIYDYIPVVGPIFRNQFWLVMAIPAVLAALALLLVARPAADRGPAQRSQPGWLVAATFVAGASVLLAGLSSARPMPAPAGNSLRILTYNIQQGYSATGQKSFAAQRDVIRGLNPDVIGLAESDTARIAGGNSDVVRYFADALGLYSYYGPSPESGTFGVALLSRHPIRNPRTFFMPSRGEQTACIEADVDVGGRLLRVLVTHLDNDGALPQQRLVIDRATRGAAGAPLAIAVGDFNFDPSTEQYRQTTAALDDSWVTAQQRIVDPGASDPAVSIDHIFVTRGARVLHARYVPEGPSDHPGMFAEVAW